MMISIIFHSFAKQLLYDIGTLISKNKMYISKVHMHFFKKKKISMGTSIIVDLKVRCPLLLLYFFMVTFGMIFKCKQVPHSNRSMKNQK